MHEPREGAFRHRGHGELSILSFVATAGMLPFPASVSEVRHHEGGHKALGQDSDLAHVHKMCQCVSSPQVL